MLVDRLDKHYERVSLLVEGLVQKPRLPSGFHLVPQLGARLGGHLDPFVVGQSRLDDPIVLAARLAGDVERERLVRLRRGVFGDLLPEKRSSSVMGVTSPSARERWTAPWTAAFEIMVQVRPVARLSAV
jgi:hypothetical protein